MLYYFYLLKITTTSEVRGNYVVYLLCVFCSTTNLQSKLLGFMNIFGFADGSCLSKDRGTPLLWSPGESLLCCLSVGQQETAL